MIAATMQQSVAKYNSKEQPRPSLQQDYRDRLPSRARGEEMKRATPGILTFLMLTGCASLMNSATSRLADNLTLAILNQTDLETVRAATPAYLLMIDGLIEGSPDNTELLLAGTRLYSSYTSAFIDDEDRARRLASKSFAYARTALCNEIPKLCDATISRPDAFFASLANTDVDDVPVLYGFATAWASWIQVNKSDWNALAGLPKLTGGSGSRVSELLIVVVWCSLKIMNGKRTSTAVSFFTAFSLVFGVTMMSLMVVSKAAASTQTEQTEASGSSGQCLVSGICPSHDSNTCFQCAQVVQHSPLAVTFSDQGLSSVTHLTSQAPYLSWINAVDPDPPKNFFAI